MTFAEMVAEVELLYESINSSASPGFTSTEWGLLLTAGQRKVVRRILTEGINKNTLNQLAIEKLVTTATYNAFVNSTHFKNTDNTSALTLNVAIDSKFFWLLDEYVSTASNTNIKLNRITYDFYRANLNNPFRVPDAEENYWILQYDNKPVFITDGTTITNYYIVGVDHPDNHPIASGSNCILNEGIHSDIVEETVKLARMSVIDTPGYQLAINEFAK